MLSIEELFKMVAECAANMTAEEHEMVKMRIDARIRTLPNEPYLCSQDTLVYSPLSDIQ